jgi:hypothetical protein
MRKTYGWLAAILLVLVGLATWIPAQAGPEETHPARLINVLEESGAKVGSVEVRTRLPIGNVSSTKELQTLAEEWANRLGISAGHPVTFKQNDVDVYQIQSNHNDFQLRYQVSAVPNRGAFTVYLVLYLKGNRDMLPHIVSRQKTFAAALHQAGLIPQFSTCIRGMYSDKLSVGQQKGKILSIFRTLQAKELERLQDETVVSITGYTRSWKPFIALNGQKMNLQVATHRDTQSEGTWITVGTPIITAEY